MKVDMYCRKWPTPCWFDSKLRPNEYRWCNRHAWYQVKQVPCLSPSPLMSSLSPRPSPAKSRGQCTYNSHIRPRSCHKTWFLNEQYSQQKYCEFHSLFVQWL